MISAADYLATARRLIASDATDADVRRAVSTAYYALFHHVCWHLSRIVTRSSDAKFTRAWLQAYRYLDHGPAKNQCIQAKNPARGFPSELVKFALVFEQMHQRREDADYNPSAEMTALDAGAWIVTIEQAIADFEKIPADEQRAFVLFIGLKPKNR